MRARVQLVLVLVGLLTLGLSSCNLLPFGGGGGGGGGGGYVQPAMSPYMNAQDLSDYQEGRWVHYKTETSEIGRASCRERV